jgi:hypothetical protein
LDRGGGSPPPEGEAKNSCEAAQVNWGRGLFRLWVIFSVLWIAVFSTVFVTSEHLLEGNKTYEVEGRFKEKYEIEAPGNATKDEVVAFAQLNKRSDCSDGKSGPWCSYPVKLQMPPQPIDPTAIYIALAVPAGIAPCSVELYEASLP